MEMPLLSTVSTEGRLDARSFQAPTVQVFLTESPHTCGVKMSLSPALSKLLPTRSTSIITWLLFYTTHFGAILNVAVPTNQSYRPFLTRTRCGPHGFVLERVKGAKDVRAGRCKRWEEIRSHKSFPYSDWRDRRDRHVSLGHDSEELGFAASMIGNMERQGTS